MIGGCSVEFVENCTKQKDIYSLVAYGSLVEDFDGIWAGHIVFFQGLLQFLQRGMVPLSKHHQVNVTEDKSSKKNTWASLLPEIPSLLSVHKDAMITKDTMS